MNNNIPIGIRTAIGKYISKYGIKKNNVIKYLNRRGIYELESNGKTIVA
jgi:hypothetical protein